MKQQFYYYIGILLALPLLPILLYMGKRVRKEIPSLGEAKENWAYSINGSQESIQLLCMGESTMAGVGVSDHKDGVTGQIAKTFHELTGKTVHLTVLAKSGYTAKDVHQLLVSQIPTTTFDWIVIGLGGNETFELNSPVTFRNHLVKLIKSIQERQPHAKIVITNMPPIGSFPAFPPLLRFFLGNLVRLHGEVIRDTPLLFSRVKYLNKEIRFEEWLQKVESNASISDFFSDGVHPSALTYAIWGKEIATFAMA